MTGMRAVLLSLVSAVCLFAQGTPVPVTPLQIIDSRGGKAIPCVNCALYTYAAGTTTPLATYTSATLGSVLPNPVRTNSAGYAVSGSSAITGVWIGLSCYKLILKDASAVTIWSQDQVCSQEELTLLLLAAPTGATRIGFQPTGGTATTVAADLNSTTPCVTAGMYVVGSTCKKNKEAAKTAAGSSGWVLIPQSYAGTDTYVAANKNIIDLRGNFFGIYQYISPSRPITGFPMGNDLVIDTEGPADLSLQHGNLCGGTGANKCPTTTTSTSISAGTQDITVASTLNFGCSSLQNPPYPITCDESLSAWIGIGTATQEACLINSIKSLTVMNVTCLHSHSGTTDVQQASVTAMVGQTNIVLESVCPVNAVTHCPVTIGTNQGSIIRLPASASDSFPANTIRVFAPLTGAVEGGSHGEIPSPAVLTLQNAGGSFPVLFRDSSGNEIARFADTTTLLGENATSVKINDFTFNTAACSGTCTINPALGVSSTVLKTNFMTGSGATDAVTLTGVQAGSGCVLSAANAAASTMLYTAPGIYYASTLNTVTFTHGSGLSGAVFTVMCGSF